jgi:hypothetical protein
MDKLKDPKVLVPVIAVILAILMGLFAPIKDIAVGVCRQIVAENPALAQPTDDLKP